MPKQSNEFIVMEVKGIAKDAHDRFPIKFDYGTSGNAYFTGCKLEATNDRGFTSRIDVQAFGEVAEELAGVASGDAIHVKGEYGMRKGSDDKYYPVLTIREVL